MVCFETNLANQAQAVPVCFFPVATSKQISAQKGLETENGITKSPVLGSLTSTMAPKTN